MRTGSPSKVGKLIPWITARTHPGTVVLGGLAVTLTEAPPLPSKTRMQLTRDARPPTHVATAPRIADKRRRA